MARKPSVRVKGDYWVSEAGGVTRYFGRCDEVSRTQATALLWAVLAAPPVEAPRLSFTVDALCDRYLDWVDGSRSEALHREVKRHLSRWRALYGRLEATAVEGTHLEQFQQHLKGAGHALMYVKKHVTSVRACYNRGVKAGWLPASFRPFAHIEAIHVEARPLLEADLPTDAEVKALMEHAHGDLLDIIRVYYACGCRTHELIDVRVGDFQRGSRLLILGKHKRSRTLREPLPRTIHLNDVAHAVLVRVCEGRDAGEVIFPNRAGKPYTSVLLDDRFARLRKRAGVRDAITIYSLRHLFISELLMADVGVMVIAKMAGTSAKMIETTYGHWRTSSFREAQARLDAARKGRDA